MNIEPIVILENITILRSLFYYKLNTHITCRTCSLCWSLPRSLWYPNFSHYYFCLKNMKRCIIPKLNPLMTPPYARHFLAPKGIWLLYVALVASVELVDECSKWEWQAPRYSLATSVNQASFWCLGMALDIGQDT